LDELIKTLKHILNGEFKPASGDERQQLIQHYLAAQDGPLACERMLDVLEKLSQSQKDLPKPGVAKRLAGWSLWALRTRIKRYKDSRPGSHNKPEFQRHRYPAVALEDMRARASRFQQLLGYPNELKIERFCEQFFRISAE
jgi:hypothetical protein